MKALIEPVAAVIRVVPDEGSYGDPFTFSATLRWVDHQTVELMGALRAPRPSEWRAIVLALRACGATAMVWSRLSGGNPRRVVIDLTGSR